jgi:hypothetical protein
MDSRKITFSALIEELKRRGILHRTFFYTVGFWLRERPLWVAVVQRNNTRTAAFGVRTLNDQLAGTKKPGTWPGFQFSW